MERAAATKPLVKPKLPPGQSKEREGATLKNYPEISGDEGRREERDGGESIKVRLDLLVFAAAFTLSYNRDRSTNLVMQCTTNSLLKTKLSLIKISEEQ